MSEGRGSSNFLGGAASNDRLFTALADYLRLPLVGIARSAELGPNANSEILNQIEQTATSALRLIDGYLLSLKMNQAQFQLNLEPVVISSVLYDSAQKLHKMAKAYNCNLIIDTHGRTQPAMAHRHSLQAALTSLGQVFIEAGGQDGEPRELKLATHNSRYGVVAGVFAQQEGLSNEVLTRAKQLYGRAKRPMQDLTPDSGVGVFVADSLFSAMATQLRVARHDKLNGLAATLLPSTQMSLV